MKKICIMTSVHPHNDVRIYHKEAKTLRAAGFDVTVICSDFCGVDENGIKFVQVEVPKQRLKRIRIAPKLFYKKALELECDYYHFHDPELIKAGLKLAKTKKVIYDVHEDVPRQLLTKPYLKPYIAKPFAHIYEKYEQSSIKRLYAIVAAEPVIYDRMSRYNTNTVMVCNYPKLEEFAVLSEKVRTNSVCYLGGITKIRGIFEMLCAVENTDIKLYLAGSFEDDLLKKNSEQHNGYKNVDYLGFIGREQVQELLSTVSVGLVTLHPIPKYLTALPVKMFEYMIAGVPVIASNFPYWKAIVDDAECGICVDPLNPIEIRNAIMDILQNPDKARIMGENGRKSVLEKYNWDIEKQKLLQLYSN